MFELSNNDYDENCFVGRFHSLKFYFGFKVDQRRLTKMTVRF